MRTIIFFISLLPMAVLLHSCTKNESQQLTVNGDAKKQMSRAEQVKRGEYLVNAIGCDDCHSPKIMSPAGPEVDPKLRLSGHPAGNSLPPIADLSILQDYALFDMGFTASVGPWGVTYAANLTPDETGLGFWSEEQFLKAIKEGKFKGLDGSRPLMPPMPWIVYKNLTDEDLKAIFAFLQSLPPVKNIVPAYTPPKVS